MAYSANEQFSSEAGISSGLRVIATTIQPKTFAAGTGTLAKCTPVTFNTNTEKWQVWGNTANRVYSIAAHATKATDGTFTLTIDQNDDDDADAIALKTTTALDHDADAAAIAAAIIALDSGRFTADNVKCYDYLGLDTNSGICYIVFIGLTPVMTIDQTEMVGNDHTLATVASECGEITTLTAAASPASAGDFTITVNGETTAAIAYGATPALVVAALEALGGIDVGDVVSFVSVGANLGVANTVLHILWTGNLTFTHPAVSVDQTGISAGNDAVLETTVAGASDYGTTVVKGFIWPDAVTLDAANEVLGQVMLTGKIHYDDIALPSGETVTDLKTALRDGPRGLGIIIDGLDQVR